MKKKAYEIKVDLSNKWLEDVLDYHHYESIDSLSFDILKSLLSDEVLSASLLLDSPSFFKKLAFFESFQNKGRGWRIYITHGLFASEADAKKNLPILLIPVYVFIKNGTYYVRLNGDVQLNPYLKEYAPDKYSSILLHLKREHLNPYDLDNFCSYFFGLGSYSVTLENYICVLKAQYPPILIDHEKFHVGNYESSSKSRYISSDARFYSDLNKYQREAVERANIGQSFVLNGSLGTGKTETLFNIILNSISRGKRVLYLSDLDKSLEEMDERVRELNVNDDFYDYNEHEVTQKKEIEHIKSYDTTKLGSYYKMLDDHIARINSRIRDFRVIDCINELVKIDVPKSSFTFNEDVLSSIYKFEYQNICEALTHLEDLLNELKVPANSIYNTIPIKTVIESDKDVKKVLINLEKSISDLFILKDDLVSKYGVIDCENFAKIKLICSNIANIKSITLPKTWIDSDGKTAQDAKVYVKKLEEQLSEIKKAKNVLYSNFDGYGYYKSDIKSIYSEFFSKNEEEKIDVLFANSALVESLTTEAHKLANEVNDIYKSALDISSNAKTFDEYWYYIRKDLASYIKNNYYNPKWLSKIDSRKFITDLAKIENEIQNYDSCVEICASNGIRSINSETIEKLKNLVAQGKGYKRLSASETSELYNDIRKNVMNVKISELHIRYRDLAGRRYEKGKSAVQEAKALIKFIKDSGIYKNSIVYVLKSHNTQGYVDKIDVAEAKIGKIELLSKEIEVYLPCDYDRSNMVECLNYVTKTYKYIQKFVKIKRHMQEWLVNKNRPVTIGCFLDLDAYVSNLNSLIKSLDDDRCLTLFGEMYQKDGTSIDTIYKTICIFDEYVTSFNSPSAALRYLNGESGKEFDFAVIKTIEKNAIIDELLNEYGKYFHEHISKLLYESLSDVWSKIKLLLTNLDELKIYIEICKYLRVLYKYGLEKYAKEIYRGNVDEILSCFKYNYLVKLYESFSKSYDIDTSQLDDVISRIHKEEKALIDYNMYMFARRSQRYSHRLTIAGLNYFNRYMSSDDFDLVIVDDAQILDANDYDKIMSANQVILAGEVSYRFSEQNNILLKFRNDDIITLNYRYTPIPFQIYSTLSELRGVVGPYNDKSIITTTKDSVDIIVSLVKKNPNCNINYFCDDLDRLITVYDRLYDELMDEEIDKDVYSFVRDHINITNMTTGYIFNADYNIIDYDYYSSDFSFAFIGWSHNVLLANKKVIFVTSMDMSNLSKQIAKDIGEKFDRKVQKATISYNEISPTLKKLADKLSEKGLEVYGAIGDVSIFARNGAKELRIYMLDDIEGKSVDLYEMIRSMKSENTDKSVCAKYLWMKDIYERFDDVVDVICKEMAE